MILRQRLPAQASLETHKPGTRWQVRLKLKHIPDDRSPSTVGQLVDGTTKGSASAAQGVKVSQLQPWEHYAAEYLVKPTQICGLASGIGVKRPRSLHSFLAILGDL